MELHCVQPGHDNCIIKRPVRRVSTLYNNSEVIRYGNRVVNRDLSNATAGRIVRGRGHGEVGGVELSVQ